MAANFDLDFDWDEEIEEKKPEGRFASTSKDKSKQRTILEGQNHDSMKWATKGAIKTLNEYLAEKNMAKLQMI